MTAPLKFRQPPIIYGLSTSTYGGELCNKRQNHFETGYNYVRNAIAVLL